MLWLLLGGVVLFLLLGGAAGVRAGVGHLHQVAVRLDRRAGRPQSGAAADPDRQGRHRAGRADVVRAAAVSEMAGCARPADRWRSGPARCSRRSRSGAMTRAGSVRGAGLAAGRLRSRDHGGASPPDARRSSRRRRVGLAGRSDQSGARHSAWVRQPSPIFSVAASCCCRGRVCRRVFHLRHISACPA